MEERKNRADLIELSRWYEACHRFHCRLTFSWLMGDTLGDMDGNWLKLTVHAMQDFTFSLSLC